MRIEISAAKQYRLHKDYYPKMGLIKIEGKPYDPRNLPDNLTVKGDLDLSEMNIEYSEMNIEYLPKNLKVGGYLDLWGNNLTSLPEDLEVGGWLNLRNNNLTSLPQGLKVGGNLFLSNNNLTSLPENLEVGGNIYLWKNNFPDDYEIPDTVKIGDGVYWR